jgi:putative transposase
MTVTDEQRDLDPLGELSDERPAGARAAINQMIEAGLLDDVMARADAGELRLTGEGGFLPEMIKAVLERGLAAELTGHLGYEKGDPAGRGSPNSRNGSSPKTLASEVGDVALAVPRDRAGTFEPRLVPKGARRAGGLDDMIISLYAGGMTVRDIQHHLERTLGTELSHDTISKITDGVLDEVKAWQTRPLEEIYPIIYLDALVVKVRDGHQVRNRAAHIAVGVDLDGVKHVLGIWVQAAEGAKFWAGVCAELRNRGVRDVLIVCCDGLTGFPEAIEATWPSATVQTCTVHLIRAAMRFVSYTDRKKVAAALRPIYTAPTVEAAETELLAFAESDLGRRYPATVATWENAWDRFIPFLAFPPKLRKINSMSDAARDAHLPSGGPRIGDTSRTTTR